MQWISMAEFTETVDVNGPPAYAGGCNYVPVYTVKWRNFYDTTLELDYLDNSGTMLVWNPTVGEFRYEIYSNDPNDIDSIRQLYYLELTATI